MRQSAAWQAGPWQPEEEQRPAERARARVSRNRVSVQHVRGRTVNGGPSCLVEYTYNEREFCRHTLSVKSPRTELLYTRYQAQKASRPRVHTRHGFQKAALGEKATAAGRARTARPGTHVTINVDTAITPQRLQHAAGGAARSGDLQMQVSVPGHAMHAIPFWDELRTWDLRARPAAVAFSPRAAF